MQHSTRASIVDRGGRRVVLKPLDDDCLLDGELHPSIALRLERVRELPMTAVANLHGVEVIDGRAFLIWDFVAGRTIESLAGEWDDPWREKLHRELKLIVERMHDNGIVHGALHARNVIVDERGGVRVTHVSPLLHSDKAIDLAAVDAMFAGVAPRAHLIDQGDANENVADVLDRGLRMFAATGAIVAAVAGAVLSAVIIWYFATS